jgi:DNA modification methylase
MTNTPIAYNQIYNMDCLEGLKLLDSDSIQICVTSPPYWSLRSYNCDGQIGQEDTPGEYIDRLCEVFAELRRVLKPDGVLWIVIADIPPLSARICTDRRGRSGTRTTLRGQRASSPTACPVRQNAPSAAHP